MNARFGKLQCVFRRLFRGSTVARAALIVLAANPGGGTHAKASARRAGSADRLFEFDSNPWNNLYHFLYVTARARRGLDHDRPAVTAALSDTAGIGALSPDKRAVWDSSVAYFIRAVADRDILFDTAMVAITNRLSDLKPSSSIRDAKLDSALTATLAHAMPIYREVWWPRHDSTNRAWISAVRPLLDAHGDSAAHWISRVLKTPWPTVPVRVEVESYSNWAGAYTTEYPSRINISSGHADNRGIAAFETLFHEVQHTMSDSLFLAFESASTSAGKRMRRDPTHVFIFYTAGEITRRLFPGYVPFAEASGFWTRTDDLGGMRPIVAKWWRPWIDGVGTMDDALRQIAREM